jgi:hypothetical protein
VEALPRLRRRNPREEGLAVPTTTTSDELVNTYLIDLTIALRIVGAKVRREYLYEIKEHIGEARSQLAPDDEQGVRELLHNIGNPDAIAYELLAAQRQHRGNWWQRRVAATGLARVIGLTTVGLLAVLVVIAMIFADLYRPVYLSVDGNEGVEVLAPNGSPAPIVSDSAQTDNGAPTVFKEPVAKWSTVEVIASLYNDGPYSVVIDSVGTPSSYLESDAHVRFDRSDSWQGGPRFHAFTLRSDQDQTVLITYRQQCQADTGEVMGYDAVPVAYSYMFFHHSADVAIEPFDIKMASTC